MDEKYLNHHGADIWTLVVWPLKKKNILFLSSVVVNIFFKVQQRDKSSGFDQMLDWILNQVSSCVQVSLKRITFLCMGVVCLMPSCIVFEITRTLLKKSYRLNIHFSVSMSSKPIFKLLTEAYTSTLGLLTDWLTDLLTPSYVLYAPWRQQPENSP